MKDGECDASALSRPVPEGAGWVVLHTRPRCEKKVYQFCRTNDISAYLPVIQKIRHYGARKRVFELPLFSGYLFAVVPQEKKPLLRQNQYVANLLDVVNQAELLHLLKQVHKALGSGAEVEVLPFIQPGKPVKITGGPFKGVEAVVANVKGRDRVVINIELINQSVTMEVATAYLGAV